MVHAVLNFRTSAILLYNHVSVLYQGVAENVGSSNYPSSWASNLVKILAETLGLSGAINEGC
ncbi:hypothetical protein G7B40_033105 [Aetokthonos hydrillicola Thurmond2011]|uniref:Uncharacterized protein n=1 Tax=Aetokthonos hydrillicola Thurmond2011 TaxID=2712845 RepID=A0AAP5IFB8_9CYAN|nr:hypothetical protein [Aetokthonos hydrillicola Thurmond2011]